jgi:hypothetical protein
MPSQTRSTEQSKNAEMLEKAYEMACLAGLFFKHAGQPEVAERLRIAVAGWGRQVKQAE